MFHCVLACWGEVMSGSKAAHDHIYIHVVYLYMLSYYSIWKV